MLAKKYIWLLLFFTAIFTLSAQSIERLDSSIETMANKTAEQILLRNIPDEFDFSTSSSSITIAILDFNSSSIILSEYVSAEFTKYLLRAPLKTLFNF